MSIKQTLNTGQTFTNMKVKNMNKKTTVVSSYEDVDIYGSEENYSVIIEMLFDYGDSHESMRRRYLNALELVRRQVWRSYGEPTFLAYEDDIKHELFFELVECVEMSTDDVLRHHWDYYMTHREFLEMAMQPYGALDCLFENVVEVEQHIPDDLLSDDRMLH